MLILASCFNIEKNPPSKAMAGSNTLTTLRDSCFERVNTELIGLLYNSDALKKHLNLNNNEVNLIRNLQNEFETLQKEEELIEKLIPIISDTTDLKIGCEFGDVERARLGDLALLSIYQVEKFPFAMALKRQWCNGGTISENIHLPYNLIGYTNFKREEIKESYTAYYYGEDRTQYLKKGINRR